MSQPTEGLLTTKPRPEVLSTAEREMLWRGVAVALYAAMEVPLRLDYSSARAQQIFAGERPINAEFVAAVMTAGARASTRGRNYVDVGNVDASNVGRLTAARYATPSVALRDMDALLHRMDSADLPAALAAAIVVLREHKEYQYAAQPIFQYFLDNLQHLQHDRPGTDAAISGAPGRHPRTPPVGRPPNPTEVRTAAEFMVKVRELQTWSGLSLRALESEAKARKAWLPRSTLADALKRDVPLPLDLLNAFTLACGLGQADRIDWELTHRAICSKDSTEDVTPAAEHPLFTRGLPAETEKPARTVRLRVSNKMKIKKPPA